MQDLYAKITNKIIADLEQGVRPWTKPWTGNSGYIGLPLRHNKEPYHGINTLLLWQEAVERGYASPIWMTYDQAQALKGQVRKDEHGCKVVYANTILRQEEGSEDMKRIPFLRFYTVFNADQITGLPEAYYARSEETVPVPEKDARLEALFAATEAKVFHGGNRACYVIGRDEIHMPPFAAFPQPEGYWATLAHEMTHWTRHPSRLDRDLGRKKWGDEGYAKEELVAELGSAFLCAALHITPEIREDHSAYIESWLEVLKHDKRFIFTAASQAQKAADYLQSKMGEVH